MEDFIEYFVPNPLRSTKGHQWQCQPFAENRDVTSTENRQRVPFHLFDILAHQHRIVICSRTIGTSDQNEPCPSRLCGHNTTFLSRNEFVITETELKLIAAAARIGLSSTPKNGYNTPAAIGTPIEL